MGKYLSRSEMTKEELFLENWSKSQAKIAELLGNNKGKLNIVKNHVERLLVVKNFDTNTDKNAIISKALWLINETFELAEAIVLEKDKSEIAEELVDVFFYGFDLASRLNINLDNAFYLKLAKNYTRKRNYGVKAETKDEFRIKSHLLAFCANIGQYLDHYKKHKELKGFFEVYKDV